ncbi:hypothetical protein A4A49_57652, partial [Nicotiana attenuata]
LAENQTILPAIEKKTLDSSVPSETPLTIPPSTTVESDTPKPDSPSPSITLTTASDHILSLIVENSDIPKISCSSSLSPEILKEPSKYGKKSETPQAEKVADDSVDHSTGTPVLDFIAPMES